MPDLAIAMNHLRPVLSVDPQPLLAELRAHPELWQDKPNQPEQQIVLRANTARNWNRRAFSLLPAAQALVFDLMRAIPGEHLGGVVLSRLPAGTRIDWHMAPPPRGNTAQFQPFHVALSAEPGVLFHIGSEVLPIRAGEAWWFDHHIRHAVFNDSTADRISMLCDIRPCEFVEIEQ